MNALTVQPQYHPQLPDYLKDPSLFAATDAAIAGINGGQPPYISIKASKFRLVSESGEEWLVNQLSLKVIVLAGNEHVSKTYYEGAYDPNAAGAAAAPACWSDNGIGPSIEASKPQAQNCAVCPHNVWGSKVTPTGSQIKACADSKKLAVVLAEDVPCIVNGAAGTAKAFDGVYMLRVPAASMRGWRDYAKEVRARGVPIIGVVTELTFDPEASYPALLFRAATFGSLEQFNASRALLETPAVAEAVGAHDAPLAADATKALPAAVPEHLKGPTNGTAQQTFTPPAPPQPPSLAGIAPAPQQVPLSQTATPPAPAPAPTTTRRRGRPPAAAPAAVPVAVPQASAPFPQPSAAIPSATPILGGGATTASHSNGVIQQPQPSSPDLDALLAQAMA